MRKWIGKYFIEKVLGFCLKIEWDSASFDIWKLETGLRRYVDNVHYISFSMMYVRVYIVY